MTTPDTHLASGNEHLTAEVQQLRRRLSEFAIESEALKADNEKLVSQINQLTEEKVQSDAEKESEMTGGHFCLGLTMLFRLGTSE